MMSDARTELPGRIAIVGLGLIGGSLARALRALPAPPEILASSLDPSDLERAAADGMVQEAGAPEAIVGQADLVVYATPPEATLAYLGQHRRCRYGISHWITLCRMEKCLNF